MMMTDDDDDEKKKFQFHYGCTSIPKAHCDMGMVLRFADEPPQHRFLHVPKDDGVRTETDERRH